MKLIDVVEYWIPGDWGSDAPSDEATVAAHCIRSADIVPIYQNSFISAPVRYLSARSWEKCRLSHNDIILEKSGGTATCSTGRPILITQEILANNDSLVCSNFCTAIRVKPNYNPAFVYYYLRLVHRSGVFLNYEGKTSGIHNLQTEIAFKSIDIPDFSLNEQNAIAKTLSTIDQKISYNRMINDRLEQTARRIYDYWFLQFDFPDANGNPYRTSGGKMTYNPTLKRDIPEGWEVKTLSSCVEHICTGLNPRDNFKFGGDIRYLTVKNLTASGDIDFSNCDYINEDARAIVHRRSKVQVGDILYASISPLGRSHLILSEPRDWDINESIFSIRPKAEVVSPAYLSCVLREPYYIRKMTQSATGSIFLGIRIHDLEKIEMLVPSTNVLRAFTKEMLSIFELQNENSKEISRLTTLRNQLLPLLMNGQVTIKD